MKKFYLKNINRHVKSIERMLKVSDEMVGREMFEEELDFIKQNLDKLLEIDGLSGKEEFLAKKSIRQEKGAVEVL